MFSVEFKGKQNKVLALKLQELGGKDLIARELMPLSYLIVAKTQGYPPPLPNQKYVRTYKLFGGWKRRKMTPTAVKIWNIMPYGEAVQGYKQAEIHQGRWKVLYDVAKREAEILLDKLARRVKDLWAG